MCFFFAALPKRRRCGDSSCGGLYRFCHDQHQCGDGLVAFVASLKLKVPSVRAAIDLHPSDIEDDRAGGFCGLAKIATHRALIGSPPNAVGVAGSTKIELHIWLHW